MRILKSTVYIPALVLLALACMPVATHADSSFTLDGAPIVSLSFGTDTFTVEMASTDAAPYLTDIMLGTKIDLLTLDEFVTVDGTTTETTLEFAGDVVQKYQYTAGTDMISSDVTFHYLKFTKTEGVIVGGDGGNGNTVPEPSSAALLASSLLGLAGFGRKNFRS
jgi:hypothetical protein